MKITYDKSVPMTAIGLTPWTRLGPERWFSDYKIASLFGWDIPEQAATPQFLALNAIAPEVSDRVALNSQQLLKTPEFQNMLLQGVPSGGNIVGYKPLTLPAKLQKAGFITAHISKGLAKKLENKVEFRRLFAPLGIPFPPFVVYDRASLDASQGQLNQLLNGRDVVLLQDEKLSSGRGTFVVRTASDLEHALQTITQLGGGKNIVVSEYIADARERSVQCVATRHGVFVGPLQKQIVNRPELANTKAADAPKFCGAEISPNDSCNAVYPVIKRYAEQIGEKIQAMGYRGIFSIDCLVGNNNEVYVLETNPRITGITPLLTMFARDGQDTPFYLLHLLEQMDIAYEITDTSVATTPPEMSVLMLYSHAPKSSHISEQMPSGLYSLPDMTLQDRAYRITVETPARKLLLQQFRPAGYVLEPGGHMATVFIHGAVLDEQDNLLPEITDAVQNIRNHTILKEVES